MFLSCPPKPPTKIELIKTLLARISENANREMVFFVSVRHWAPIDKREGVVNPRPPDQKNTKLSSSPKSANVGTSATKPPVPTVRPKKRSLYSLVFASRR